MIQTILIILLLIILVVMIFMMRNRTINTYFSKASFQDTEKVLVDTIAEKGWKLLSMHDIQSRLVNAGFDFKRIAVYEICRPDYAAMVLEKDVNKKFSSLMPCRISVYELADGTTGLAMINAGLLSQFIGGVVLHVMSKAARESEEIIHLTIKKAEQ
ncbi:MAG: DUF302 domain-containing protein [Bacteroidales bacterium]